MDDASEAVETVGAVGRGANKAIVDAVGAPADIVDAVLSLVGLDSDQPVGGSDQITKVLEATGILPRPGDSGLQTKIGEFVGTGATIGLGLAPKALRAAKVMRGLLPAAKSTPGAVLEQIGGSMVAKPGTFIAGEVIGGTGGAVAGFYAEESYPDSPGVQALAEIAGGFAAPLAVAGPMARVGRAGFRAFRDLMSPFTPVGATQRAETALQTSLRGNADAALQRLGGSDVLPEAGLTPAQLAGDDGLLSLERSVIETSEAMIGRSDEQIARAAESVRRAMLEPGGQAPVEATQETIAAARKHLTDLLEARVTNAARIARERMDEVGPLLGREEANEIVREELDAALKAARVQETDLWQTFGGEVEIRPAAARKALERLTAETPQAQRKFLPEDARGFLIRGESNQYLGDVTTAAELQGLRSTLLEDARIARAAGRNNEARMAEDVADGILADLGAKEGAVTGPHGEAYRAALDFSRNLNQRFTQGAVGRLMRPDRFGGPRVDPSLTLERTIRTGGPAAGVQERAILNSLENSGQNIRARSAIESYLGHQLQEAVDRSGIKGARAFLTKHGDSLREFPEFRTRVETAVRAGSMEDMSRLHMETTARGLGDPKQSAAAAFIGARPEDAIAATLKAIDVEGITRELMRQASRDTSGQALQGLRSGFSQHLLEAASVGPRDASGLKIVSGRALRELLDTRGPVSEMARTLLSQGELDRLRIISNTAARIEAAVAARPRAGGVIDDQPSKAASLISRIGGAQLGRLIAAMTGGGTVQTPGLVSGAAQTALKAGVRDPAQRLLIDAVADPELFRALMTNVTQGPRHAAFVRTKMNAWLAQVANTSLEDEE